MASDIIVDVLVEKESPEVNVEVANRAGGLKSVLHDETLLGDGVKEPLGVNPNVIPDVSGFATKEDIAGKADKSEIPTVPTKLSAFENDKGYLTEHQDISGKQDTLVAGDGITIDGNKISSTSGTRVIIRKWS